jgi:hypothetical protein
MSPLVDLANPTRQLTASLSTPFWYDVLAPLSDILDTLTLLSPAQYWASFGLCAAACVVAKTLSAAGGRHSWKRAAARFTGVTIAVLGTMLVAKRPMAALSLRDPDLLAVDFHSHTSSSHDGRAGFGPEENRRWHSSAGFDAVYVTDHRTFDGVLSGSRRNPITAAGGTVLLPGVELRDGNEHPILIGVDPKRMKITSPDWQGAAVAADGGPAPPLLILSLPGDIRRIPLSMSSGPVRIMAVEASDGSPRGIAQSARDHIAILSLARKLGLAVVSASDNHGWGRTSPAWSVMRIPGWRGMTPSALDIAIRRTIVLEGARSVQVIERRTPMLATTGIGVAFGGVAAAAVMLRTMSLPDRCSWIVWTWILWLIPQRAGGTRDIGVATRAEGRRMRRRRPIKAAA